MGILLELKLGNRRREIVAELPEGFFGTLTVSFEHGARVKGPRDIGTAVIKFENGNIVARENEWRTPAGHRVSARRGRSVNLGKGWTDLSTT
jgi:hypothetical protein